MLALFPTREIFLSIGGFSVHWYGMLYVTAFALALFAVPRLQKYRNVRLSYEQWIEVAAWTVGGVVIGGRLGYVLLYEPLYFAQHPLEVLALWQGGMASHGGFVGAGAGLWLASLFLKVDLWRLVDVVVVPAAIGLALGRLGNVINQELFATPLAGVLAVGKNVLIAATVYWHVRSARGRPGQTAALFLVLYSILRFLIEQMRVQDYGDVFGLTRGQLYTVPVLLAGVWLWRATTKQETKNED